MQEQEDFFESLFREDAGAAVHVPNRKIQMRLSPHDKVRMITLQIGFRQVKREQLHRMLLPPCLLLPLSHQLFGVSLSMSMNTHKTKANGLKWLLLQTFLDKTLDSGPAGGLLILCQGSQYTSPHIKHACSNIHPLTWLLTWFNINT